MNIKNVINITKQKLLRINAIRLNNIKKNTLFISTYHDQALIPFKIINKKSLNMTIGLNYRRLSPAHGTARNIKFKNISDNTSYITCLLF